MTDRPIIFSALMVRALLDGRKTQTRRVLKMPPGPIDSIFSQDGKWWTGDSLTGKKHADIKVPYAVGDRLWVRENWKTSNLYDRSAPSDLPKTAPIYFTAHDRLTPVARLRPSIHMPRWASRLTLLVTGVKIERLQDISEEDAKAEGLMRTAGPLYFIQQGPDERSNTDPRIVFRWLWTRINGAEAWEANLWVVAVSFTVHRGNIDAMEAAA